MGTAGFDAGKGVAVDASGNVYVVGRTGDSLNGQPYAGYDDIVLAKFAGTNQVSPAHGEPCIVAFRWLGGAVRSAPSIGAAEPVLHRSTITVAVADFTGQDVSAAEAAMVAALIRTELVNIGVYPVVERGRMDQLLAEAGFQMSWCTDTGCAVEMGQLLNARQMVIGTVSKLGELYVINASMVDVETGRILKAYKQVAESKHDLMHACAALGQLMSAE